MIIDFHTHIFPDKITTRTISIFIKHAHNIPAYVIKHLQSLSLTKDDIDAILSGNAIKLLGL